MTRLRTADVAGIAAKLSEYDAELLSKTGCSLRGIACRAAGVDEEAILDGGPSATVAAVPITSGLGRIGGFTEAVSEIAVYLGFEACVTERTDVAGLAEAVGRRADVVMLADDDAFVALCPRTGSVTDNAEATGRGYAAALHAMAGGLKGRGVLVIGCGRVGRSAAEAVLELGAELCIHDIDVHRSQGVREELERSFDKEVRAEEELARALARHECIIDASPASEIIDENHVSPHTLVCAPGIPHGLSPGALGRISGRLVHDPLQIGVATMLVECFFGRGSRNEARAGA